MTGLRNTQPKLTLDQLQDAHAERCQRWHGGDRCEGWSLERWSNAMCGEAGEAANIVKKINRVEDKLLGEKPPGVSEEYFQDLWDERDKLYRALAKECADVLAYLFCVADRAGFLLSKAVVEKFNEVSEHNGFPERL